MKELSLPPFAASLMESMRSVGYSLESALADLIDNSISAGASGIDIQFRPDDDAYISILDNGIGMSPENLNTAMQYGSTNPLELRAETDLGRYGLGLKTASLSQCRRLTVISKHGGIISARCWDMDLVTSRQAWIVLVPEGNEIDALPGVDALKSMKSGTIVLWQNLDKLLAGESSAEKALGSKIDHARFHLAKVFHRYLAGEKDLKKVTISINNNPLPIFDPFLQSHSATQPLPDEKFTVEGRTVLVRPFILPHISKLNREDLDMAGGIEDMRSQQGFYVYRNKRLIISGTWFRLARKDELSKLARVRVDIPNSLDHLWTLDIKKSVAHPPEAVRLNLRRTVEQIGGVSRRTYEFRGRKVDQAGLTHGWQRILDREGVRYAVNRDHPAILVLAEKLDNDGMKALAVVLDVLEKSYPADALYADIASDQKIDLDAPTEEQMREMATTILAGFSPDSAPYKALVASLHLIEPFSRRPEAAQRISKELSNAL